MSMPITNPRTYAPGDVITAVATAGITARRFLRISGNRNYSGSLTAAHATAAGRVIGVASADASTGGVVAIVRDGVARVTADGPIAAFDEIEVGTDGKAKTKNTGVAVGVAVTGAASGTDAEIALY